MRTRDEIEAEIKKLKAKQLRIESQLVKIEELKAFLTASSNQADSIQFQENLEELAQRSIRYRVYGNKVMRELQSLELTLAFEAEAEDPVFERIIVGGGVSATMLYKEIAPQFREAKSHDGLPHILVLNDPGNPNTWKKEGNRLMGQPAHVQTPPTFDARPESFVSSVSSKSNPYDYVVASHFSGALTETQNELQMPILNIKSTQIQSQDKLTAAEKIAHPWKHSEYPHRVAVIDSKSNMTQYLYTRKIDLCVGLGEANELTPGQIQPALATHLQNNNQLLYAQDGDMILKGDVMFYGGSAINAAWIAELNAGHSSQSAIIKYWITPRSESFNKAKKLNRLISSAMTDNEDRLATGSIEKIEKQEDGRLAITFKNFSTYKSDEEPITKTVICDQFIVSTGQKPHQLTQDFSGFVPAYYHADKDTARIPLGTHSPDNSIVVWGAAGTLGIGLDANEQREYIRLVGEHAQTFPHESHALGGIYRAYWTIQHLAKELQGKGTFPYSANYQIHGLLPDINLATQADFKKLIDDLGLYQLKDSSIYASKIVALRSQQKSTSIYDLPGISSIKSLQASGFPLPVIIALQKKYFPHEFKDIAIMHKHDVSDHLVSNKLVLPRTVNLKFFADRQYTNDTAIFVSDATPSNTAETKEEDSARQVVSPKIISGF